MDEPVLTTEEIAERLRVNVETPRRWIRSGKLRALRAGGAYRVTESALKAFLSGEEAPRSMPAGEIKQQRNAATSGEPPT